ncbi:Glutamate dehydrogenase [Fusobacterium necrophorum]|nr:Glu/Leu/Phe/Val dehydrogenase dimerization domain-containing protein [Fusobacterium necrophorum]MBR8733388.1 Glutamate dehydrogenase [Fusobacterium necrophorum]MBR8789565.1 Glutamate dehydrogenase [Fusobacterium necrophorum]
MNKEANFIVEYFDEKYDAHAWLVIDDLSKPLAAGGLRVKDGLTKQHVINMAKNMSKKMKICNLNVSGAKSGIDFNPKSPNKKQVILRFMKAIKPFLETRYSMGSDLNTNMRELEEIAHEIGLKSVKAAIEKAQGLSKEQFDKLSSLLQEAVIDKWTLGEIRAGYAVAASALSALRFLGKKPEESTAVVQGFGVLAKACIIGLLEEKVKILGISDQDKLLYSPENKLPIKEYLEKKGTMLPEIEDSKLYPEDTGDSIKKDVDLLVLAAIENTITAQNADSVSAKVIVQGANLAVADEAKPILKKKNIIVLPSYLSGAGGPISMNALFGANRIPLATEVLQHIKMNMDKITKNILETASKTGKTAEEISDLFISEIKIDSKKKPYEEEY